jgi:hypothetical protein
MQIDDRDFFQKKIKEYGFKLAHDIREATGEGRYWKLQFKNGDILEFEWQSMSIEHQKYDELWIEYDPSRGGIIFDLRKGNTFTPLVVVKNDEIEAELEPDFYK